QQQILCELCTSYVTFCEFNKSFVSLFPRCQIVTSVKQTIHVLLHRQLERELIELVKLFRKAARLSHNTTSKLGWITECHNTRPRYDTHRFKITRSNSIKSSQSILENLNGVCCAVPHV